MAGLVLGGVAAAPPSVVFGLALAAALLAGRPGPALLCAAALLAGAGGAERRLAALDRSALGPRIGHVGAVGFEVLEAPRPGRFGRRLAARLVAGAGAGERVLITIPPWLRTPVPSVGALALATGRLARPRPTDLLARARRAHAVLLVSTLRWDGRRRGGVDGLVDRLRARAEAALAAGPPAREAALLRGMALGEDEALTQEVRLDFRRAGLSHLVAASGQNVVLLCALAAPFLALAGLGLRARLLVLLGLVGLYVPLAGGGPAIQRAGIMGAAGIVAALAGRPASRWYALGLAAAATLALDPRAARDPGWQMSFAAVLAILLVVPRLRESALARRLPRPLAEVAAVTLAASLATAPLIALHFTRVSLVAIPANLLAAPAVAPVMWLGLAAAATGQVSTGAAGVIASLAGPPLGYLEWLAHAAGSVPSAEVHVGAAVVLVALGVGAALALGARRLSRTAPARRLGAAVRGRVPAPALALVSLATALLLAGAARRALRGSPAPPGVPALSFLDVGQGDATLLQDGDRAVLVDAGPREGPILARLREAGVGRLDALVITHAQADHEGGAAAVMRRYPVGLLLDGGAGAGGPDRAEIGAVAAARGVRVVAATAGERLRAGRVELRLLWPPPGDASDPGGDPNLRAVVAVAHAGPLSALLTADAESPVTAPLELPAVTVLKVAHHGSADPGLGPLLARIHPRLAVIEVGRHNPYGHPTAQALAALRAVPRVLRTDRDGTIRVLADGPGAMRVGTSP